MSLESMMIGWKAKGISPAAKLTLIWISDSIDECGLYYFHLGSLQEFTGCTTDEINEHILELQTAGLIKAINVNAEKPVYELLGYQP